MDWISPEVLLGIYGTLVAPLLVAVGRRVSALWAKRGRRGKLIRYLAGLPPELKAVLAVHHVQRAHTVGGDPSDPAVMQLANLGLLRKGVGRGSYDAVNAYLVLRTDVFDSLGRLLAEDPGFAQIVADIEADWMALMHEHQQQNDVRQGQ